MTISLKWGGERLHIAFPGPSIPLGALRNHISEHIGVPRDRLKMIRAGAVMTDDTLPLSYYNIRPGVTISLVGTADTLPDPKQPTSRSPIPLAETRTEQSTIQAIRGELSHVSKIITPDLDHFYESLRSPTPPPKQQLHQAHARLGELLLQSLLKLDSIVLGEWEDARKERKLAVKEVQKLLDDLDAAWKGGQGYVPAQ